MMKLNVTSDEGNIVRVRCEGEISQVRLASKNEPLEGLLSRQIYACKVLLNLENAEWLDSSGISWLITVHKNFQKHGGALVLCSVPPRLHQILVFCKMEALLHIVADEMAGLACETGAKR